jgi:plasmid replication initiation protein
MKTLDLTPTTGEMIKPKELIDIRGSGPLTLADRRIYNLLIENAWGNKLGVAGHWFEIGTGDLRDATDDNTRLKTSLERLMQTICLVTDNDGNELRVALLSTNKLETNNVNRGTLKYTFPPALAELLAESKIFAKLDLQVMKSFGSKYAFTLYEWVARRAKQKYQFTEELTVNDLREILGVETNKLTAYKNLNKFAIQPALTEVNGISPFNISIVPKKTGRKVTSFLIGWSNKSEEELKAAYAELNRHSTGRKQRLSGTTETVE